MAPLSKLRNGEKIKRATKTKANNFLVFMAGFSFLSFDFYNFLNPLKLNNAKTVPGFFPMAIIWVSRQNLFNLFDIFRKLFKSSSREGAIRSREDKFLLRKLT
jgi:hypothetical protein